MMNILKKVVENLEVNFEKRNFAKSNPSKFIVHSS